MEELFSGCSSLTSLDLSSFDTTNVEAERQTGSEGSGKVPVHGCPEEPRLLQRNSLGSAEEDNDRLYVRRI